MHLRLGRGVFREGAKGPAREPVMGGCDGLQVTHLESFTVSVPSPKIASPMV